MKSYLLLLKLNFMSAWNALRTEGFRKDNGNTDLGKAVLYGFAFLSLAALAGMVIWMEVTLYNAATTIHMEKLLIGLSVMLCMITTVLFALPHTLSALYLSKDTPSLAHLPLKSRTVMAAKWTQVYLFETLTTLAFAAPLVVMYGLRSGNWLYWPRMLTALMTVPIYPLGIALILASILGRLSSMTTHKDAWLTIGSLSMVAIVLWLEWTIMPRIPQDADARFFITLITNNEALLKLLMGAFPPVLWTVNAITGSWTQWLMLIVVALAGISALLWLLGGDYLAVCLRHTEHAAARKSFKQSARIRNRYRTGSQLSAVFRLEMTEVLRIPTYLINGAVGVLMPAIMVLSMSISLSASEETADFLAIALTAWEGFSAIDRTLLIAAVMGLLCWLDVLPATSVSREGKRLPVTRMIPVPALTIVRGKLLVSLTFNAIGSVLMGAGVAVLLGVRHIPQIIAAIVLVNLLSYAVCIVNLAADVIRPSFNWKNETEAIKQNMNSMIGMLFSTMMLAVLIVPPILLMDATTPALRLTLVCGLLAAMTAAAEVLLRRVIVPKYEKLEP